MSLGDAEEGVQGVRHPRQTTDLVGHEAAERAFLDAYRSGRIPHAWLIGGPRGIGKATLAYRIARFVLAHPDPSAEAVRVAADLHVAADHPLAQRVASEAHGDLLTLERRLNDRGKLRQDIAVDDVRQTVSFFGSTAWEEQGWRIAVVDAVEELNPSGANALLKVLEEPPPRALLLLISHVPGQVLPTLRSRCRMLPLKALAPAELARAAGLVASRPADDPSLREAAELSEGSVARALALLEGAALGLHRRIEDELARLPATDPLKLHGLGDALAGTEPEKLAIFTDTVNAWLAAQLRAPASDLPRLARMAEVWEKVNNAAREADEYNLERKPLVFAVFGLLADAVRG